MPRDLEKEIDALKKDLKDLSAEYYRNNFTSNQDFNKFSRFTSALIVPVLTATPATCEIGQLCSVSGKLRICSASNTWAIVGTQS